MTRIAVVGMACRYPDATSPRQLWENALAGRRAFRRLPDERMRLDDYWDADPSAPDRFYARHAAVIEGYEFDRVAYKIPGSTYRSTDLTHWLALDMAAQALADAGFTAGEGLPRERTGVVVGNTLTGEFTRANLMRLRWPYVRRVVGAALREAGWEDERTAAFLADVEEAYKRPFPPVDEDTLAGGLSNTIAGRICNHFDLGGGGFTVDGACSSSLLSVSTACRMLADGELDVAVAGGVDLSIDPFEIIGFAKTGALARGEMRVYDRGSNGFWPGEGCGMLVLMREADAADRRVYASIAGWGISSDGSGGITRPEAEGYRRALRRAYDRAGFGIGTVELFEGHGTGTPVGDANELTALSEAVRDSRSGGPDRRPVIGSIKGMIGHTKAAAGVAGLIKAVMAVHEEVLPPAVGCVEPHALLAEEPAALRVLRKAEPWPEGAPVRAGVTAMGFGGINTHVVVEKAGPRRRGAMSARTRELASSVQDAELLLVDAASPAELRDRLARLAGFVPRLSYAELADLAAALQRDLRDLPHRAAVVVSSPEDAEARLGEVLAALDAGETALFEPDGRAFLGKAAGTGRVGYLFPGQGSGRGTGGGMLRRRFTEVEEVYAKAALPSGGDTVATAVAQPRIVTGSLAGLRALSLLGVDAAVAVGHSLGEISALHWAGAMDEDALLRVAGLRGRLMTEHSAPGAMAGIAAAPDTVTALTADLPVVIAGYNGPAQTVVAGPADAVEAVGRRAGNAGLRWTRLAVSHAFHSPLVAPAADALGAALAGEAFGPVGRRVVSTVTERELPADTDVAALLRRQITEPVRFVQAVEIAAKDVDLFVEVGPGRVLAGLASSVTDVPAVALDTDDESARGLLRVAAAAYVTGVPLDHGALFHGRPNRPLEVGAELTFFAGPCEQAPQVTLGAAAPAASAAPEAATEHPRDDEGLSPLELLRRLAAERAELPLEMVRDDSRLLDDLHLSSITVGKIVEEVVQRLGGAAGTMPGNYATATVGELAEAVGELAGNGQGAGDGPVRQVEGAAPWARAFAVELAEAAPPPRTGHRERGRWRVHADAGHPFAEELRRALEEAGTGDGTLVCLPRDCAEHELHAALQGAKAALGGEPGSRFVLVQQGRGAAGLAKTLRQEAPHLRVTIVHLPESDPPARTAVQRVVEEVAATSSYAEVHYGADGVRRVPRLRVLPVRPAGPRPPLDGTDVLLVTGGGKGITAECALAAASAYGAKLAVLGRSDPARDEELAANLRRMADAGVTVRYLRADVTDAAQVRAAVAEAVRELGPVTAVVHGSGRNEPGALVNLDMEAFRRTFAPKVGGLRAVLDAVDPQALRLLVTFGSIIGRAGLRGEAHYATANEWLAELTEEWGRRYPHCRTLCMEWSVWSDVGMGERLSVIEPLVREGITPISPEQGVEIMRRLLEDPGAPATVVVSGRTGTIDTIGHDGRELPLLRFTERPLVHYPGVELVTEVELNPGTDLYLADHGLDGNLLFPAVFGMEAMAQAAAAVTGRDTLPVIEDAEFLRPIVVSPDATTAIRVAVVVTGDDTVQAAVRSAETVFAADHFRARLRFGDAAVPEGPPEQAGDDLPDVPLDPAADLYGGLLFQGRRFQRLERYHRAAARHVDADVAAADGTDWFAGFLPAGLLLGDPGARDVFMHGNQVCVPDATLLPTGIERLHPGGAALAGAGTVRYCATERWHEGDTYVYDIAVRTPGGRVVERWEGLRLQAVRKQDGRGPWPAPLLGPYLERTVEGLLGARVAVAVEPCGQEDPDAAAALAVRRALGRDVPRGPDGGFAPGGGASAAVSCGAGVALAAVAAGRVACRVEPVAERPEREWSGLLGPHAAALERLAGETGESADSTGARLLAALRCLRDAGVSPEAPLAAAPDRRGAWVVLTCGSLSVATLVTTLRDRPGPVAFAVLTGGGV
ncbi:SDR family NAD(P)-dependent oxidoreductase [Planomonospora sp. ID91781]|uniref:type I polyketide synthase n=1 Tax=Planomonospora sp. ID91781 TaxID=2738135 RepID=UPI0018C3CD1E|nr:type I polyketide synthase [Planomonospora sp. ID91781]MBG0823467.1 SDR family NAD(P)-dependent oxidoreductase [Planomonospora sp. ID91781]